MRYRPADVTAAILSLAAPAGDRLTRSSMQVVYSPSHLGHDITHETYMGVLVPANEVAERAEIIRTALDADGGFPRGEPTEHGLDPILAVHDPGLVRFLEEAWPALRAQQIPRPFLSADTYPNRSMFEGMSEDAIARFVREPEHAGGRAGFWGLDSAAPLVAGTYVAARGAVDVALTAVDLVLDGGETAAYGLCRPPGPPHAPARCTAATASSTTRPSRPRRSPPGPASGSPSSTSTTTTATAPSRSSGGAATCATSRSMPTPIGSTRTSWAARTRPGKGRAPART